MSDSSHVKTAAEVVAEKIIARLVEARLIINQDNRRTLEGLANGSLKAEDWQLLAEKVLEMESREGDDVQ